MTQMQFTKATRKRAKLRVLLASPAGGGKTTAALNITTGLGGKTAVIDTERGSASLYSDQFNFDTLELNPPYSPERFIDAIRAAEAAGYDNLIIDSATHEWDGSGGVLEINEHLAQAKYRGNTWSAWSESTPRHRAFIDAMLQCNMHLVITARSKTETVQGEDKKVRKVGMKIEQRAGLEYEASLVFELDHESHLAVATKDRTRMFATPALISPETGKKLLAWLEGGTVERMSPDEVAKWVNELTDAATMDDLKASFQAAHAAARRIDDAKALEAITAAKDARKAALSGINPRGDGETDPAAVDKHFAALVDILNEDIEEMEMALKLSGYADEHLNKDQELYIAVLDKLAGGKHCPKAGWNKFMSMAKSAKQEKAA
jgi:hypothetical protein